MNRPKPTTPSKDAVRRALSNSDADAVVMLLAFLVVAVCGACELVLFLPHAFGAVASAARPDAAPAAVTQTLQEEAREMPPVPTTSRPAASGR